MTEDEARQVRIDGLIAEMESTIAEAQETSARMADLFRQMGMDDETLLADIVRSDRCSPALRAMVEEDLARLDREMQESDAALLRATARDVPRPRRRRRMTRI